MPGINPISGSPKWVTPQASSDTSPLEPDMVQLLSTLEQRWPELQNDWQCHVSFSNERQAEVLFRGVRLEIDGIDRLTKLTRELQEKQEVAEKKHEEKTEELARVKHLQLAISVLSAGWRFGAGMGLIGLGQVVPGGALVGSAMLSAAHEVAQQLDLYQSASESLGGKPEQVAERKQMLQSGAAFVDFSLSLATLFLGGTTGLSEGWKAITGQAINAQQITNVSAGAQSLMMIRRGRLEGERGKLEVMYQGVQLDITVHGARRDDGQEHLDQRLEDVEKVFTRQLHVQRVQKQLSQALARGCK